MSLVERDLKHIWHPSSQMKDYENFPPLEVVRAEGPYLYLKDGRKIFDAISSWWCKSLGHGHPRLKAALTAQMDRFEHVILANTTNETIVRLGERLAALTDQKLDKVFFASDGSSAVEIAVKMSLLSRQLRGETKKTQLMTLENDYHGETMLTLALSDYPLFRKGYEQLLPKVHFLKGIPYVFSTADPLWTDCAECWPALQAQLDPLADVLSAIVVEPIVQGASGMLIYSADFLRRLRHWCTDNNVHLIADEMMTGFGRTGPPLACDHAGITPDFICMGKALTAGWLPMSVVLTSTDLYNEFYDDYDAGKSFFHSHTFSGNVLAAAVAVEMFNIMDDENIYQQVQEQAPLYRQGMQEVADQTGLLKNVRAIGAIAAADIDVDKFPHPAGARLGYEVYRRGVEEGILLRPLGNTICWIPPLNVESPKNQSPNHSPDHGLPYLTAKAFACTY